MMVGGPKDLTMQILRQIQAGIADQGRGLVAISEALRRQVIKIDELFESSTMAPALAGQSKIRHETVQKRLEELVQRVERLERQS